LQPMFGIEVMRRRRLEGYPAHRGINDEVKYRNFLCNGPGVLSEALGVTAAMDKMPLFKPPFELFGFMKTPRVLRGERVGVTSTLCDPRRFALADCSFIRPKNRSQLKPV
jgi:DNA-3-methyladenine glycosylase